MDNFVFAFEIALGFKVFEDLFATFGGGKTFVGARDVDHGASFGNDLNALKMMAFADFKIVEIVRGGDFDGASAIFWVGVFVGDDRDFAVGQRELDVSADQITITLVARIHSDGDVTKESFWTSSRNCERKFRDTISQRARLAIVILTTGQAVSPRYFSTGCSTVTVVKMAVGALQMFRNGVF